MKYLHVRHILFVFILLLGFSVSAEEQLTKGSVELSGVQSLVWGEYTINPVKHTEEQWNFYVVVVPKTVRQGKLIEIARDFFKRFPHTRVRFFSDTEHLQQYIDRDRYFNDSTGTVREVSFPDSTWIQDHFLANINNRSGQRKWILENRYGSKIHSLP
ncbi:hypothetical protein [Marinobacter sp. LV10MA510-1]|uniref:hypothetical protein n=1 Tax=Marinobacter sp. LV10MA510-1 TaxID=1415567 RepID=UPI000BF7C2C5|nr:hypothetical protein [Marinobacter sp. LV10MA510-1]PFG11280.1 hypothetical protein ATI45_3790 [Marinobacter sp. LV10MA510-1]